MSRIGNTPITIDNGVQIALEGKKVVVKGPKGELSYVCPETIECKQEDEKLVFSRINDDKQTKAFHGLARAIVNSNIIGVTKGFQKELELIGVGYKAQMQGTTLVMNLGFSHEIRYEIPKGVEVTVEKQKNDIITVSGIDKQQVGQVAAYIRSYRPPEPYKGKGIRYRDEHVARKEGKRVGSK